MGAVIVSAIRCIHDRGGRKKKGPVNNISRKQRPLGTKMTMNHAVHRPLPAPSQARKEISSKSFVFWSPHLHQKPRPSTPSVTPSTEKIEDRPEKLDFLQKKAGKKCKGTKPTSFVGTVHAQATLEESCKLFFVLFLRYTCSSKTFRIKIRICKLPP